MTDTTTQKTPAAHTDDPGAPAHAGHPSDWEYVKVAAFLAIVTAAEVGLYYVKSLDRRVVLVLLCIMMVVKFAVVAMWFMHLRFDSKIFRRFFITGILLAFGVYLIVLTTFHVWSRPGEHTPVTPSPPTTTARSG
ncbi:MAG: cytochrome C oxidase subunit IV family protein [Actinomycetota bacterium]|nr:cytochrome C oxidase subunit IV family protein [Actinomycetota bacterium]